MTSTAVSDAVSRGDKWWPRAFLGAAPWASRRWRMRWKVMGHLPSPEHSVSKPPQRNNARRYCIGWLFKVQHAALMLRLGRLTVNGDDVDAVLLGECAQRCRAAADDAKVFGSEPRNGLAHIGGSAMRTAYAAGVRTVCHGATRVAWRCALSWARRVRIRSLCAAFLAASPSRSWRLPTLRVPS